MPLEDSLKLQQHFWKMQMKMTFGIKAQRMQVEFKLARRPMVQSEHLVDLKEVMWLINRPPQVD